MRCSRAHNLPKGRMNLIDAEMAEKLYGVMGPARKRRAVGGNTIAGIAMLGGKNAYIGKVADDQLGKIFTHDIRAAGVTYDTPPLRAACRPRAA
jgi:sugar/nucleoside kinase (ribokinase family)